VRTGRCEKSAACFTMFATVVVVESRGRGCSLAF
jgi:hypothetical protein